MRYRQLPQLGSSRNRTLVALAAAGRLLQALRIGAFPRSASARSRLTARDKNHPCVVIWSIANEPDTVAAKSRAYFEPLFAEARRLDPTRRSGSRTSDMILAHQRASPLQAPDLGTSMGGAEGV
jgi:hypothetical protein